MSNEQKLREALHKAKAALSLALSDVDWRKDSLTQPVIHKAYNCAHEALAMPTAAPVGELPELPEPTWSTGLGVAFTADQMRAYAREAMRKDNL